MNAADILHAKILVVDDQAANVLLLERMLGGAGYTAVASTTDPFAVCELHGKHHYDLILLDIQMPGMDGFEVMQGLKAVEPEGYLPVLAITAQPAHKLRALQAGAKDFISKPFEHVEVLSRIRNMLEVRLLQSALQQYNTDLEQTVRERTTTLRESEELFNELASNLPQILWIRDVGSDIMRYVNPSWEKVIGQRLAAGDSLHKFFEVVHPDDGRLVRHTLAHSPHGGADLECRIVRPDGTERWLHARTFPIVNATGQVYRVAGIMEDITERKEAEHRLLQLAHYDPLTGLPNRTLFYQSLHRVIAQAEEHHWTVAVLFLDLDRFKHVNDTLGHVMGDMLLRQCGARLLTCLRIRDTVARIGGDEFGIVLLTDDGPEGSGTVAHKIREALRQPFELHGREVTVTASIGIAVYPVDAVVADALVKHSETAMYQAKEASRDTYRFYTASMNARAIEKLDMENALRKALDREEFVLHYQPKMQVNTGRNVGVEALIRWNRPGYGLVSPLEFIPMLEKTGLIVQVGAWVIRTACTQIAAWKRTGVGAICISVNVSGRQFARGGADGAPVPHNGHEPQLLEFELEAARALQANDVDPSLLEFELTESLVMSHAEESIAILRRLKALGIRLSIDDFGTGYSSLAYLKRLPIDIIKIDRAFIRDVTTNAADAAITSAIISMAHSLKLKVIAEGVETSEQLEFLRQHGCDEIQGYYLSKPLPALEVARLLSSGAPGCALA